ncbi:MAG: HXXEE domain-containing protein [Spirochaetia bacterium]|nr:HXXEE domain-containing protein [Spirochaetia bacterium]
MIQFEREHFFSRLIWLFPAAFAVHIVEESLGFSEWVTNVLQGQMNVSLFYINNAGFMVVLFTLTALAARKRAGWSTFLLFLWVSGQQFWNFVFHIYSEAHFHAHSPGYFSAIFLYFPIYLYLSYLAVREKYLKPAPLLVAFAAGAFGMWFTIWSGLYHFESFPWSKWIG